MQALKEFKQASASQISTFRDCNRKWWIEKMLGIKVPASQSQQFGSKVHAQLEHFVQGKILAKDMMAEAVELIKHIPDAKQFKLVAEPQVRLAEGWAVPLIGYIDLAALCIADPGYSEITDYKTTKNFAYMPTLDEMWSNPQTVIYCQAVFESDPKIDTIKFTFAYTLKGYEPESRTVSILVSKKDERFEQAVLDTKDTVSDMAHWAIARDLKDVPPNFDSCGKYGGCPHRHLCPELKKQKGVIDMGIFDNADAPAQADAAVAAAQAAAQPAPAQPAPVAAQGDGINPPSLNAAATASPLLSQPPQEPAPVAAPAAVAPVAAAVAPVAAAIAPAAPVAAPYAGDGGLSTGTTAAGRVVPPLETVEAPRRKRRTKKEIRRDTLNTQCGGDVNKLSVAEYNEFAALLQEHPLPNFVLPPYAGNGSTVPADPNAFVPINQRPPAAPAGEFAGVNSTAPDTPIPVAAPTDPLPRAVTPEEVTAPAMVAPATQTGVNQDVVLTPDAKSAPTELKLFIGCKPNYLVKDLVKCLEPLFKKIEFDNNIYHWNQIEFGKGQAQLAALINVIMLDENATHRLQLGLTGSVYFDGKDETLRQAVTVLKRHATLVVE